MNIKSKSGTALCKRCTVNSEFIQSVCKETAELQLNISHTAAYREQHDLVQIKT